MQNVYRFPHALVRTKPRGRIVRDGGIIGNADVAPLYVKQEQDGGALERVHAAREKLDAPQVQQYYFEAILTPQDRKLTPRRVTVFLPDIVSARLAVERISREFWPGWTWREIIVRPIKVMQ